MRPNLFDDKFPDTLLPDRDKQDFCFVDTEPGGIVVCIHTEGSSVLEPVWWECEHPEERDLIAFLKGMTASANLGRELDM